MIRLEIARILFSTIELFNNDRIIHHNRRFSWIFSHIFFIQFHCTERKRPFKRQRQIDMAFLYTYRSALTRGKICERKLMVNDFLTARFFQWLFLLQINARPFAFDSILLSYACSHRFDFTTTICFQIIQTENFLNMFLLIVQLAH